MLQREALRRSLVFVVALAVLGTAAGSASASFPGRNGEIAYRWVGESAYRAGPTATSIRTVDPRSGRVRVVRDCPLLPLRYTDCSVGGPRYAPDGQRIAFPTIRIQVDPARQPPWQYWPGLGMVNPYGTGFEEHATEWRHEALAWSPAGDRLLLQRELAPGSPSPRAIFLASLDGSELRRVTYDATGAPDWASTGRIAFTRTRTGARCFPRCSDVYVMRPGGTPRRLTYRGGSSPSWSPDGKKLAFVRVDLERARRGVYRQDVYIVGRDGRGLRRLTQRGATSPAWSPDGRWIAFIRRGDVYVVRTSGRGLRRLVNAPPPVSESPAATSLDWQPIVQRSGDAEASR